MNLECSVQPVAVDVTSLQEQKREKKKMSEPKVGGLNTFSL